MKKIILVIALTFCMMGKGFGEGEVTGLIYVTGLYTAPNLLFNLVHIHQLNQPKAYSKDLHQISIVFGLLQAADGGFIYFINHSSYERPKWIDQIAFFNIGFGTVTAILGELNLLKDKKFQDKRTSWNLYSFPARDKTMGMGMSFSLRF